MSVLTLMSRDRYALFAVILKDDVALLGVGETRDVRYLLAANAESIRGVPRSNSTTFAPFSQCSPWLPRNTSRELFHWPTGFNALPVVRREQVVERAGAMRRELVVLIQRIVEHLVLEAERCMIRRVLE